MIQHIRDRWKAWLSHGAIAAGVTLAASLVLPAIIGFHPTVAALMGASGAMGAYLHREWMDWAGHQGYARERLVKMPNFHIRNYRRRWLLDCIMGAAGPALVLGAVMWMAT